MNKKLKILSRLLAFALAFTPLLCLPFSSTAEGLYVEKGYGTDNFVYAPADYSLVVTTNVEEPTYQWFVGVGRNVPLDELILLEDDEGWSGTQTARLTSITHDGMAYSGDGNGWDGLYFCCRVTDKNGRVFWGPDMNMVIHTHAALLERLRKDGVEITAGSVRYRDAASLTFLREENGVTYYESCLDKAIVPSVTFHPMDPELRLHAKGDVRIEKFVTCGGKTVPFTDFEQGFRPEQYGTAVIFRTDLVLYVNDKRMETLDSVTSVVNVKAPSGVGTALTKTSCSVLAEQYSQARVLTNLGPKTRVTLLAEAGGYWRVAAGGYFGYIPKTALNVSDAITSVAVTIAEPTAYQKPAAAVVLADPDLYELDPQWNEEMWYDQTAGKFLQPNDVFLPGHAYRVVLWLSAQEGKRFPLSGGKPDVAGWVNGTPANVITAYEQDPEEIIEISYTFEHVHDLKKINRVYPTCTTDGKEYHYYCQSCGWSFEDAAAQVRITDEDWGILPARGHWESEWKSNGTQHYKVCQRRNCLETIPGTPGTHVGGKAACYSRAVCDVCGLPYGDTLPHTYASGWTYRTQEGHAHGCAEPLCTAHDEIRPHRPGPVATATEPQVCLDCGYILAPAGSHQHTLTQVKAITATCTRPGYTAYYVCDGCEEWFSDAAGRSLIADHSSVVTPALGHVPADEWTTDKDGHRHLCSRCGETIAGSQGAHADQDRDGACDICGYSMGTGTTASEPAATDPAPTEPAKTEPTGTTPSNGGTEPSAPHGTEPADQDETSAPPKWLYILIAALVAALLAGAAVLIILYKKRRKSR